jgi:type IV secretion system protein VirD4
VKSSRVLLYLGAGLALPCVASVAALYLSGAAFLALTRRDPHAVTISTTVQAWDEVQGDPRAKRKLKLAMLLGVGLCFGLPLWGAFEAVRQRRPLHGAARFARFSEVRKAGLTTGQGIVVGKLNGQWLTMPGQQFVKLSAPTRSGKGVGVVIPNCLLWPDSMVVNDIKGDNFQTTAGYRAAHGQEVYIFDPFSNERRTHRWNPIIAPYVRPGYDTVGDLLSVAQSFYPNEGRGQNSDGFFNDQARNLFLGLGLYLHETAELPCTIGEMLRVASGNGRLIQTYLGEILKARQHLNRPLSPDCVAALSRFLELPDNTRGSVLATFNAPLVVFVNPVVDAATSANDFLLTDLRRRRMTVYVRVPPERLPDARVVLNLFFTQIINVSARKLPKNNPELKYQCCLMLDEFPALGRMEVLLKGVAFIAEYNLRFVTIAQSDAQLVETYGLHAAHNFATNHAMQIMFAPRELDDAKLYSETLGYYTEVGISRGKSSSFNLKGGSSGTSTNHSEQRRALLLPQEFMALGPGREVIVLENCRPILAQKIRWYEEPVLKDRPRPAPAVAPLDMELHCARVQRRIRVATQDDVAAGNVVLERIANNLTGLPSLTESSSRGEMVNLVQEFLARCQHPGDQLQAPSQAPQLHPASA